MASQTIGPIYAIENQANTVCRAYSLVDGSLVASSATLSSPGASGIDYFPVFTDLPAAEYRFVLESSAGSALAYGFAAVTLTTATFPVYGQPAADLVSVPSEAAIAAEVDSVLTAAHGSGGWTTAVLSSVTVGGYASGKSPAEALIDHLETQTRGKGSLSYLKMLELNTAALLGKASAPSSSTETFVYADGVTDAFTVTFDANGYRTGVTIEN